MTFDRTISFHLNGETIKAVHVPLGHTDGDAVLFFENANVVHMGDLFFNEMYPVIDISAGGSAWGMINAIDTVLPMLDEETVIIPGHGAVAGIEELKAFQTMLKRVSLRVELLIDDGKSVEEIVALQPSVGYDAAWSWQFMPPDRFTKLIHASLIANPRQEKE